ncbi:hypothetical protein TWF694_009728 [Orbilia ellipsospora]|uniref:SP-RING-type domain-containing protein n=1 Tax=Orbilia ellipsospora TaxID=2528407 RepID=A0AAV9XCI5_9PEZI
MHDTPMVAMEPNRPGHETNRGDDALRAGQAMRIDTSAPSGHPGRPSLTSPLKRKSSFSRHDIDLANVNNTVSMFMGGRRHSWMHEGNSADAYAHRPPPVKRVKTTPTKAGNVAPQRTEAPVTPIVPSSTLVAPPSARQEPKERVVITIPDTQPEEQQDSVQGSSILIDQLNNSHGHSRSLSAISTTERSSPSILSTVSLVPQIPQAANRTIPSPIPTTTMEQTSISVITESRASPVSNPRTSLERQTPLASRSPSVERAPRARPTIQTPVSSSYLQNMTPPPSTSPVSSTMFHISNNTAPRSAHPSTMMPSPLASPQMQQPSTIDVPKYLPDGSCQMHTINLSNASIEDHNLILGDLQRLGQQIKDAAIPNQSLVVRYSKLNHALDIIRRQINQITQTQVQSTSELVSDILRRTTPQRDHTTPSRHTPPYVQAQTTLPSPQSMFLTQGTTPALPPINRRVSVPQNLPQLQAHSYNFPPPVMAPPPQPNNQQQNFQNAPSMGYFRPPAPPVTIWTSPKRNLVCQSQPRSHQYSQAQQDTPQLSAIQSQRVSIPQAPQHQSQQPAIPLSTAGPGTQLNLGIAEPPKTYWSAQFYGKLSFLMKQPSTEQLKPNDRLRASLLENAIMQNDDLFVALHLIFCTADHPKFKDVYYPLWQDSQSKLGFELLSQLLYPNFTLSTRALDIFCQIPFELGAARMTIPGFDQTMAAAITLLQNIRPIFDALYNYCIANKVDGISQSVMSSYGVKSPALQRTIGVSLSQMVKSHRASQNEGSQREVHRQSQQSNAQAQIQETIARQHQQRQSLAISNRSQIMAPTSAGLTTDRTMMIERPDFHIFTTDWGSKVPGWKLIPEWRHIPADLERPDGDQNEYFTYFKRCVSDIIKVESVRTQNISFLVEDAINKSFPKPNRADGTALNLRPIQSGSKLYRLRCVLSATDLTQATKNGDFTAWRSHETAWPQNFFAELNDKLNRVIDNKQSEASMAERELSKKRKLHFRRKRNWGKDCPTDLTDGLEPGVNTVQLMMLDPPTQDGSSYYLAVEEVEIADYNTLQQQITQSQMLPAREAKSIIVGRLKRAADAMADDDDISVVENDTVVVSITCPMSQQLIDIPVRGKNCTHLDCFDLKGFLTSRTKQTPGFSVPDSWKCPICSVECAPTTLILDGFMQETCTRLRERQIKGEYLDTKSVVIRSDGLWRPNKPTEPATKKIKKETPEVISLLDD